MLLAAVVAGSAGLILLAQHNSNQDRLEQLKNAPAAARASAEEKRLHNHTGIVGDISQVYPLLNEPGYVVHEEPGVDLAGLPFRWLHLSNGAIYRSYDTKNPRVFVPK